MAVFFLKSFFLPREENERVSPLAYYDESHSNVWGLWDSGYYGFSEFALVWESKQIPILPNTKPLDELIHSFPKEVLPHRLLVLNVAKFQRYTQSEIEVVHEFVKEGGNLFVFGEHDNMYQSSDFQNSILEKFGLQFENDHIGESRAKHRKAFSEFWNLNFVYHKYSASIRIDPQVRDSVTIFLEALHEGKKFPIAVGRSYEKGKVFVMGDSELFWNENTGEGIEKGENLIFLKNIIRWFFPTSPPTSQTQNTFVDSQKTIFIEYENFKNPKGLESFLRFWKEKNYNLCFQNCAFYFAKILIRPLSLVSLPKENKKMILFAESFDRLEEFSFWDKYHLQEGSLNRNSLYETLQTKYGLRVLPCFLTEGRENIFQTKGSFENQIIPIHRGTLFLTNQTGWTEFITIDEKAVHCETTHIGMTDSQSPVPVRDSNDFEKGYFSAYSENLFFVGDSNLIFDEHKEEKYYYPLLERMYQWLEKDLKE